MDAFEDAAPASQGRRAAGEREAKLDVDNFLVQANGSGIREALRLMLDIELDGPSIVLIEEPETHLHPALESAVMRYLKRKSDRSQIFLTTHSTNFVDSGEYSAIHFVQKFLSTTSTLLTQDKAGEVLPQELGLRLSSLFMYEKLVFVEGVSDEDVIREWASTLGVNLSQANVGFINIGGSRNIKHFASAKIADFLRRRGVQIWFVLDRDENNAEDAVKLQSALGTSCNLVVLPVREIENFLLQSRPLADFISKRIGSVGFKASSAEVIKNRVSPTEIATATTECADALRAFALGKRILKQVYFPIFIGPDIDVNENGPAIIGKITQALSGASEDIASRIQMLEDTAKKIATQFDTEWANAKLEIVPGTELLAAVLGRYKVAYKKNRDAREIAAAMNVSEIPQQVKSLLNELSRTGENAR